VDSRKRNTNKHAKTRDAISVASLNLGCEFNASYVYGVKMMGVANKWVAARRSAGHDIGGWIGMAAASSQLFKRVVYEDWHMSEVSNGYYR